MPEISQSFATANATTRIRPSTDWLCLLAAVTIVCISRLVYRKGIDLLIAALPKVCALHPDVRFLIGKWPSVVDGPRSCLR